MAPPASFITISSIPFSRVVTQAEFNVANEIWFKYTATIPIVIGFQINSGGTFNPANRLFQSDGVTTLTANVGTSGFWWPLFTAADYYIRITRSLTGASDFDFTFTVDTRPLNVVSIAEGDIIVNDDDDMPGGASFPAVILSNTGEIKFFTTSIPAGETGAILPSNVSFWHDAYSFDATGVNKITVVDANLTQITTVTCGLTGNNRPRFGTDVTNDKVYVINQDGQLWTISGAGVAANTGYTFPAGVTVFPDIIAVNEDGTKLYWFNAYARVSGIIHTLNLTTFTALPDLYTIPGYTLANDYVAITPNSHPGDMFVMPNGNVVTWWKTQSTSAYHLIVINSSGSLLYSYDYASPTMIDHLAYINEDSDHILVWWFTDIGNDTGRYGRVTLATGVIDQDHTHGMFSGGQNPIGIAKFGPSNSCTFVRLLGVPESPDMSGIYYINPQKVTKHDSYYNDTEKKIPNPTIRTALIGE